MNRIIATIPLLLIALACTAQSNSERRKQTAPFPKDSALCNIKDSILIGKYFVAVKGIFFDNSEAINPLNAKVFVKGYKDSNTITLKDLKQNFKLLSSDSSKPVLSGTIALLKTNNAHKSTSFMVTVYNLKEIPGIDILEEGDIIAFVGMLSRDQKNTYTFPATWYKIVK